MGLGFMSHQGYRTRLDFILLDLTLFKASNFLCRLSFFVIKESIITPLFCGNSAKIWISCIIEYMPKKQGAVGKLALAFWTKQSIL